jgi:uncharacterized protein YkwD
LWLDVLLLVATVVVAFTRPTVPAEAAEVREARPVRDEPGAARSLLELTNADRTDRDLAPLTLDERVSRYAERHSRRMARLGSSLNSSHEQSIVPLGRSGA